MALCHSVLILSFPLCGPVSGWLSGMIPTWIMLAVQVEARSFTSLTSETASSLGALANVLGSALLDSHHVNAQLSPHKPHSLGMANSWFLKKNTGFVSRRENAYLGVKLSLTQALPRDQIDLFLHIESHPSLTKILP